MNTLGSFLKLSVKGASHAPAISFTLEGLPADFPLDEKALAAFMARRAPGRDALSTARREPDAVELDLSAQGVIAGVIRNRDTRPQDYGTERTIPRPSHADFGQWVESGRIPTGGGKNSGRLTAAFCAAGGICVQYLASRGITVAAEIVRIGRETNPDKFEAAIRAAKDDLDSIGGIIRCRVTGVRPGLGGALYEGLESALSAAVFAIPGVKGIAFGNGFAAAELRGSENNDAFVIEDGQVRTVTNRHGGILGGRTTGMPIEFTVAMKPTPTIFKEQASVDLATMTPASLAMKGRHDPCIVRRAVPVVEAMAAYAIADALCADEALHPRICLTLTGATLAEDLAQFESQRLFTDMVEVRVDRLKAAERKKVAAFLPTFGVPAVVTFRRKSDGGAFEGAESVRAAFFRTLLKNLLSTPTPSPYAYPRLYVDFEDDFRDAGLSNLSDKAGVRIIRSLHDFTGRPRDLVRLCRTLRRKMREIPKIAFQPKNLRDVARAFKELEGFREFPHIVCAMGPMGLATRVLAGRLGSMLTYASVGGLGELGHISPAELVRTYRFRTLTPDFALYGVTGWPLKATRSPEINNLVWADADEDSVMIPFPSETAVEAIRFMRAMGMRGLAVTIPYKQAVMRALDSLTKTANAIGAVNTVAVDLAGRLAGHNTDAEGFSSAITRFVGREDFAGLKVAVLGAGGASKAVVHALRALKAKVEVFHRRPLSGGFDLIVNATPVDPIPDFAFTGRELVYDLVYVPAETPLMARARAAGCRVENGFSMLTAQAAAQRRVWRMLPSM